MVSYENGPERTDPAPRQPYNPASIWKCKFCNTLDQSTEHYVRHCKKIKDVFGENDRENIFEMIRTLGGTDQEFEQVTNILVKVYEEVIKP